MNQNRERIDEILPSYRGRVKQMFELADAVARLRSLGFRTNLLRERYRVISTEAREIFGQLRELGWRRNIRIAPDDD